jgi:hypothetical protein
MQEAYWEAFVYGAPRSVLSRYLDWLEVASHRANRRKLLRWVARERVELDAEKWSA